MKFEAAIERDGKKIFEAKGDKEIEGILLELDYAVKKEIDGEK